MEKLDVYYSEMKVKVAMMAENLAAPNTRQGEKQCEKTTTKNWKNCVACTFDTREQSFGAGGAKTCNDSRKKNVLEAS